MKNLFFYLFLGTILLSSCDQEKMNAEKVATSFLTAISKKDFSEASKYCDETSSKLLSGAGFLGITKDEEAMKFSITKSEVKDDTAIVYFKQEGNETEEQIDLKKIDGEWKVVLNKEKLNKENFKRGAKFGLDEGMKAIDSSQKLIDSLSKKFLDVK